MWFFYIVGATFFLYPFISSQYHQHVQRNVAREYQEKLKKHDPETLKEMKDKLQADNLAVEEAQKKLTTEDFAIEAEKKMQDASGTILDRDELGDVIAVLEIPKIRLELPVYYGTNSAQISNGAGVMKETSLPIGGKSTHSVITSHRGLPTAKLFNDLPKLALKDNFFVKVANETHAYEVDQIKVIEPDDYSALQIVPGEDYITLLTCTPYMINSHRLLVRGKRITPYSPNLRKEAEKKGFWAKYKLWFWILLLLLLILLLIYVYIRSRNKEKEDYRSVNRKEIGVHVKRPFPKKNMRRYHPKKVLK